MTTNNFLRRFLVGCWRLYRRILYQKRHVMLDYGVEFNKCTHIGKYVWIHHHTNIKNTEIGDYTYVQSYCKLENCKIGRFCSVGDSVKVLSATHPTKDFVSTSPVFFSTASQCLTTFTKVNLFDEYLKVQGRSCVIEDDVWVGSNVIIIGGVTIGAGAIVAAGAVVNKNVPPYAIVAGVPAKILRYRFDEHQIKQLLDDPWWNKSDDWIRRNASHFVNIRQYLYNKD